MGSGRIREKSCLNATIVRPHICGGDGATRIKSQSSTLSATAGLGGPKET